MIYIKRIQILVILLITIFSVKAQNNQHEKKHFHNDFGIANAIIYSIEEDNFSYGLYFHVVKGISHHLGLGIGYEVIFGEHLHQTINLPLKYILGKVIALNIGTGVILPTEDHEKIEYTMHFEIISVFEFLKKSLWPYAWFWNWNN